jgi:pimeloyl-ACP methyl ester carboxylesterase
MPHLTTSDGVRLHYQENGSGKIVLMIPGWSQSAALFKHQLDDLSDRYRVIAVDMRGHGESDKPDKGYMVARLAKDVHELIIGRDLQEVNILGHSMGASIIWSYWDLFGSYGLKKIILVDEAAMPTATSDMTEEDKKHLGAFKDFAGLEEFIADLNGPKGEACTKGFVDAMLSQHAGSGLRNWVLQENLKMPRQFATRMLFNHALIDWRHLIPLISLPTLVIGGRASIVPWTSQVWIHQQIAGSRLEIFEENECGSHLMFIENAMKFNNILAAFIG